MAEPGAVEGRTPNRTTILGCGISVVDMPAAVAATEELIEVGTPQQVCVPNVHVVVEAQTDDELRTLINDCALAIPDGMPLVWVSRRFGLKIPERVAGADFLLAMCELAQKKGYRFYFMGAAPGIADRMVAELRKRFPKLDVAGTMSPPYGDWPEEEDERILSELNASGAHVLWVGMSAPRQEKWIAKNLHRLQIPVSVGVGAAFDYLAGSVKRAPKWMQRAGLEWLYRLVKEPRRLWRRYLVTNTKFVMLVCRSLYLRQAAGRPS